MNDTKPISCEICRDLFPIVKDGLASEESQKAVFSHMEQCPECKKILEENPIPHIPAPSRELKKVKQYLTILYSLLMMFGLFFGFSLTAELDFLYNCLIMPIVGILGYLLFRKKSLVLMPVLLLLAQLITKSPLYSQNGKIPRFPGFFFWTLLYCIFVWLGILIAGLLHFAFKNRKKTEKQTGKALKITAATLSFLLIAALSIFACILLGNPVSGLLAKNAAKKRIAERYADKGYQLQSISYSFQDGHYTARIEKPGSTDCRFTMCFTLGGKLLSDNYENDIVQRYNTFGRLDSLYHDLTRPILRSPFFPYKIETGYGMLDVDGNTGYISNLILDGSYNISKLGSEHGVLILSLESDGNANAKGAAKIALELKDLMERGGVGFAFVDLTIKSASPGIPSTFYISRLPYSEIYEENFEERIKKYQLRDEIK